MASFGQLTGATVVRSLKGAQRLGGRIIESITRAPIIEKLTSGIDAVTSATRRFLSAFGTETARLNRLSIDRLTNLDPQQQNKIKQLAIAEVTSITRRELSESLTAYENGRIDIATLRERLGTSIRRQTLASAIIGVGGIGNLTENVLTAVRRQLTEQFKLLDGFVSDIAGRAITPRDRNRLAMFGNLSHTIAQTAQRQLTLDENGVENLEERRVLGAAEHCEDCVELAGEGWQPAGSLPPIGQGTVCGNSCKCIIETRVTGQGPYDSNIADSQIT